MTDVLAIGNASAGTATQEAQDAALAALRQHHDVTLVTTSSPDAVEDAIAEHRDAGTPP